jgi:hypothetical protein
MFAIAAEIDRQQKTDSDKSRRWRKTRSRFLARLGGMLGAGDGPGSSER